MRFEKGREYTFTSNFNGGKDKTFRCLRNTGDYTYVSRSGREYVHHTAEFCSVLKDGSNGKQIAYADWEDKDEGIGIYNHEPRRTQYFTCIGWCER